jgi:hypothetical protein
MAMASLTLILAASVGIHAGHVEATGDCRECVEVDAAVQSKVEKLRTACLWIVRRKAARELGGYEWEQHPEAVEALADAVLHDRQCLVRQEAAASLGRMKPCHPVAHEALAHASENDSSLIARRAAKKALKAVGKACVEPCDACGPVEPGFDVVVPPLRSEPGELMDSLAPETRLEPLAPMSSQVPAVPVTPSPFAPVEAGWELPPPRRAQPPTGRPGDAIPLVAPEAPIDRHAPLGPAPTPIDIPAPQPGWPR